ncbi:hypothetical protein DWZ57_22195, partial [Bacteroides fragilis]
MLIKGVTGTVIEKTKSEPFHKIKGKVKLSFYYQIECFYLFTLIKGVTGTVIEKTKSEPFHKIKGKVKLSFYYQIECF